MKKENFLDLVIITFLLLAIVFLPACKKASVSPAAVIATPNKIAYIYKTDSTNAHQFRLLLEANNCALSLIDKSNDVMDYSSYKLIVIDDNTDGPQVTPDWSTADTAAVNGSGKPILLLGNGGLQFAQKLHNTVCRGNCASTSSPSITVMDASSNLYKYPKPISLPAGNQLDIFSVSVSAQGLFVPVQPVAGVQLIAKFPLSPTYMPVNLEKSRYGVFGFSGGMSQFTSVGKDFMVNMVFYTGNLSL